MGKGADTAKHAPKRWDESESMLPFPTSTWTCKAWLHISNSHTSWKLLEQCSRRTTSYVRQPRLRTPWLCSRQSLWTEYKTAEDITMMTNVLQDRENGHFIT
eukprot:501737-Rhodomonas_salina.1